MNGKKINVYYRDVKQTIKIFDNTSEDELINLIKKIFHLEANNSKIFFQDEEGNFLLIPKIIPDGLNVHLYIEPEFKQDISQIKLNSSLLPGFKWDDKFSLYDGKAIVSNDGYVLGIEKQLSGWTPVVSTTVYRTGKLFCKLNIKADRYQAIGVCNLKYNGKELHRNNKKDVIAIDSEGCFYKGDEMGEFVNTYAFLLNMYKKKFIFYEKKGDIFYEIRSFFFDFNEVKIYAWVKRLGFSILEGGSSEIPEYLKND